MTLQDLKHAWLLTSTKSTIVISLLCLHTVCMFTCEFTFRLGLGERVGLVSFLKTRHGRKVEFSFSFKLLPVLITYVGCKHEGGISSTCEGK